MFRTVLRLRAPVATLNGVRSAAAMRSARHPHTHSRHHHFVDIGGVNCIIFFKNIIKKDLTVAHLNPGRSTRIGAG